MHLNNPERVVDGLYRSAKFSCNRCNSFDNMPVLMFREFGLIENAHSRHFLRVFLNLTREWGSILIKLQVISLR